MKTAEDLARYWKTEGQQTTFHYTKMGRDESHKIQTNYWSVLYLAGSKHILSNSISLYSIIIRSQPRNVKNKLCQTNLISFYNIMIALVAQVNAVVTVYLDLSIALILVQHGILGIRIPRVCNCGRFLPAFLPAR